MIQAQDLRIGNWVSNGQIEFQITSKDIYHLDVYVNRVIAKPIPITPEWLERMGMKRNYDYGDPVFDLNNIRVFTWPTGIITIEYYYLELRELEFIHQLQNLYFALTGEDLTINEV